ncbi:hypothetical protein BGZ63DRAFT_402338 [Mariannaea sp. PMI_226]|nr:hypothetical protein BGZ63DRAFT_402338 [Mariannaea sp. PMI_226]
MDPYSGPSRPALQSLPTEDTPIASDAPLARYEFSGAGTKVLMVEWSPAASALVGADADSSGAAASSAAAAAAPNDDSAPGPGPVSSVHAGDGLSDDEASITADASVSRSSASASASDSTSSKWEISWAGKTTTLHAADADVDTSGKRHPWRRVFFLLPPGASIPGTITLTPPAGDSRPILTIKPLPAIFPPGFHGEAGARGVLHTIWARRRLAVLDKEIADEMRVNAESVGLEIAVAEKKWIQDNFIKTPQSHPYVPARSNISGRLGDKLRGLKLATAPADLFPGASANTFTTAGSQSNTLSPQHDDIAFSSFSAINSTPAAAPMSLNAALHSTYTAASAPVRMDSEDTDDDLFALPLSPRSPDMKKSPFSAL